MALQSRFFSMLLLFFFASMVHSDEIDENAPVPTTMNEAFLALDKLLSDEQKDEIRSSKEADMFNYHFGLGMWMRSNWGLWRKSDLAELLAEKGIGHPDDMSGVILDSYWRYLNGLPIELDDQARKIKERYDSGYVEDNA